MVRCACQHSPKFQHDMKMRPLSAAPLVEGHMREHELQHLSRHVLKSRVAAAL